MSTEIRNIIMDFNGFKALNDISFKIEEGEFIAILGPSGCGKSTLSQILAGYMKPDKGEVYFDGKLLPEKGYCPVQLIYQHPEKAINPRWKLGRTLTEAWEPDQELLDDMVVLFLVFQGTSILFPIVVVLAYIPTNSAGGFPFLHTPSSI